MLELKNPFIFAPNPKRNNEVTIVEMFDETARGMEMIKKTLL